MQFRAVIALAKCKRVRQKHQDDRKAVQAPRIGALILLFEKHYILKYVSVYFTYEAIRERVLKARASFRRSRDMLPQEKFEIYVAKLNRNALAKTLKHK